jgi:Taurine catabolism dioxygenase TauD, TfdA family
MPLGSRKIAAEWAHHFPSTLSTCGRRRQRQREQGVAIEDNERRPRFYLSIEAPPSVLLLRREEWGRTSSPSTLLALATRPERIYAHRWRAGDLLVWDNASMMHKALPPADGATKKTYRITIKA